MAKKKTIKSKPVKRKQSLYQKISKRFTKYNNSLPQEQRISYKKRRDLIRENILPQLKGVSASKIKASDLDYLLLFEAEEQPKRLPEECNPLLFPPDLYSQVVWFDIDSHITNVLPDCIFIQVNAGQFGKTNIFNTRNYNYYNKGVRDIVENIRKEAQGALLYSYFEGNVMVIPGKKDDKKADSYYIEYVLYIDNSPVAEPGEGKSFNPKAVPDGKRKAARVKKAVEERLSVLKKKKSRSKNAVRTLNKNKKEFNVIMKKTVSKIGNQRASKILDRNEKLIEKYKEKKVISQYQYEKQLKDLKKKRDILKKRK